ncbi:zinc finger protein 79 [Nematostella vectensis]|nr:zinc finger protein 79 [Nematostella vectensis]
MDSAQSTTLALTCSPYASMFPAFSSKTPLPFWSNGCPLAFRGETAQDRPKSPNCPTSKGSPHDSAALVPIHSSAFHPSPPSLPYRLYQSHGFMPATSIHATLFPNDLCPAFPAMPPVFSSGLPIMPRAFHSRSPVKSSSESRHGLISPRESTSPDGPKNCHVCGKSYARLSTLRLHMRTHSGVKPYQCMVCLKSFTQAANLTAHFRIHSGEKPFRCRVCGRQFSQSSSVTTHMRTHNGERPYKCKVCNKAFADSSTLTKHVRTHTGEKPYQCEICHQRFSQSGNMNRHKRIHNEL